MVRPSCHGWNLPTASLRAMGPEDLPSLLAGSAEVVPAEELERKLTLGRPLRVKLGLDPTAPVVTLGWAVVLHKLRQFQDAGHTAVLIVGDFTAQVGDPSGKTETRPRLSAGGGARVRRAAARPVLEDPRSRAHRGPVQRRVARADEHGGDPAPVRVDHRRADARTRRLRQALRARASRSRSWSSSTRCSRGWTRSRSRPTSSSAARDQTFNLLVGRDLQREFDQEPQVALTTPLLVGTDGVQKMSQSLGNYIGITDPPDEMFGKLCRVPDELIPTYRLLALDFFRDPTEAERVETGLEDGSLDAWDEKRRLAREVVDLYHGQGSGAARRGAVRPRPPRARAPRGGPGRRDPSRPRRRRAAFTSRSSWPSSASPTRTPTRDA